MLPKLFRSGKGCLWQWNSLSQSCIQKIKPVGDNIHSQGVDGCLQVDLEDLSCPSYSPSLEGVACAQPAAPMSSTATVRGPFLPKFEPGIVFQVSYLFKRQLLHFLRQVRPCVHPGICLVLCYSGFILFRYHLYASVNNSLSVLEILLPTTRTMH